MKRTKLGLLFALSGAMILASCGGGSAPKAKKYNLTFHQTEPGEIEDVVIVVTKGKTTNPEVWEQEPDINPKVGYTAVWEEYDVETMTADLIVEPEYTAIQYTATFFDRVSGEQLGTDQFTVEDESLDYPELPTALGYTYSWEEVTISAQNLTVYCDRVGNEYTVSYEGLDTTTSVTFGQPYELEPNGAMYDWYYGDEKMALTGNSWNIADDITLVRRSLDVRLIDFEDGLNRLFTPNADSTSKLTLSVVDGEGVNGSKALSAVFSASGHLDASKDYLDAVFADQNVKALSFFAKATAATSDFRHITVDKSFVHDNNQAYSTYESNISNYGVATGYKQFYLTRGVYEQMSDGDWFIQYGTAGTVYLDNLAVSYHDYFDAKVWGFENGWWRQADASNYYLYNPIGANTAQLLISGSGAITSAEPDYSVFSEGTRSVKVVKASGQIGFYLRADFLKSNLPDEGIFVDFRSDSRWNESWHETSGSVGAGSLSAGNNSALVYPFTVGAPASRSGVTNIAGQWQTFHLKKSDITDDGRFLITSGGATGNVYLDNVRLATLPIESFENAYAYVAGETKNVVAGASSYPVSEEVGTIPNPLNKSDYIFTTEWGNVNEGKVASAKITSERASDGDYSLKIAMPNANKPLRIRPSYVQTLIRDGGTISFDIYSDDLDDSKLSFTTLGGNVKTIVKGQWTTVTLELADFLKDGDTKYHTEGRFTESAFGGGTIYIDNIRYHAAA